MPKCKKCNKEITKGSLCEHCKAIIFGKIKTVCGGTLLSIGTIALAVITKGKVKPKL